MEKGQNISLKIKRQASPHSSSHWEEFSLPYTRGMTLVAAFQWIESHGLNARGEETPPVAWGGTCLEGICGGCTVIVNGQVVLSCSLRLDNLKEPITVEPLSKLPLIRDLLVDHTDLTKIQNRVMPWTEIDGLHDTGEPPRLSPLHWEENYPLSLCTMCGACLETCPQYNNRSDFWGAAVLNLALLAGEHPLGKLNDLKRTEGVMGKGGIADCSHVANCEVVCPMEIPLADSMARLARKTTGHWLKRALGW